MDRKQGVDDTLRSLLILYWILAVGLAGAVIIAEDLEVQGEGQAWTAGPLGDRAYGQGDVTYGRKMELGDNLSLFSGFKASEAGSYQIYGGGYFLHASNMHALFVTSSLSSSQVKLTQDAKMEATKTLFSAQVDLSGQGQVQERMIQLGAGRFGRPLELGGLNAVGRVVINSSMRW